MYIGLLRKFIYFFFTRGTLLYGLCCASTWIPFPRGTLSTWSPLPNKLSDIGAANDPRAPNNKGKNPPSWLCFLVSFSLLVFSIWLIWTLVKYGPIRLIISCCFVNGIVMPFPSILLTPVDANKNRKWVQAHLMHQLLVEPQLWALFLLLLEGLFLLKKMQVRQEIPHVYFEQIFAFY